VTRNECQRRRTPRPTLCLDATVASQALTELGITQHPGDAGSQGRGVSRLYQQARLFVVDDMRDAAGARRYYRHAGSHGLDSSEAQRFRVGREGEDIAAGVSLRQFLTV